MNATSPAIASDLWSLAGWTMIHFLWLGTIVAAFAFAGRLILSHAAPNVRYAFALSCLILLTAMPLVAAWFSHDDALALAAREFTRRGGNLPPTTTALPFTPTPIPTTTPAPPLIELHTPPPITTTSPKSPALDPRPSTLAPSRPSTLDARSSTLTPLIPYLPWLWLIGTPLTFALLFTGLIGTRRLSRASMPITAGPIADALARLTTSLRLTRRVTVAVCERVAAPVLIGIVRPMILLPPAALTGWSPDEIEMVLLHELAHIRRYDNIVNLAQRIIESLLFFHPAVWLISTWVRREREACCDAAVVESTQQPHAYAELLLNIAAHLSELSRPHSTSNLNDNSEPGRPRPWPFPFSRGRGRPGSLPVSSPMAAGPLRTRIRHILQLEDDPMLITPKSLAITLATLLTAATLAFVYLPTIGQAEPAATEATENTEKKQATSEAKSIEEPTPEPVLIPFNFVLKHDSAGKTRLYMNDQPVADDVVRNTFTRLARFIDKLQVSLSAEEDIKYDEAKRVLDLLVSLGVKRIKPGNLPPGVVVSLPPSAKEIEITKRAEQLFGLKVTLANGSDLKGFGKDHPKLVLSELANPQHTSAPLLLVSIDGKDTRNFEQLGEVLDSVASKQLIDVGSVFMSDKGPVTFNFQAHAPDAVFQPMPLKEPSDGAAISPPGLDWYGKPIGPDSTRDWSGYRIAKNEPATDDWPKGVVFPSPKEGEISKRAWKLLHVKVVPASDEELQQILRRGKRGGLKLVDFKEFPHFEEPFILTDIGSKPISRGIVTFDDLDKVMEVLASEPADEGSIVVGLHGEAKNGGFHYALRYPLSTSVTASTKFPTLENQKLADLAWKRLGLELEPIAGDDLQRVKALGYDGGVKVTAGTAGVSEGGGFSDNPSPRIILPNDILVGLHVWPTTNLKDIATILNRDDLAELNPLKFYVVRRIPERMGGSPTDPGKDTVVTGRINVELGGSNDANRDRYNNTGSTAPTGSQPAGASVSQLHPVLVNPSNAQSTPPSLAPRASQLAPQATLRYDGKPFEAWRNVWKTELSTEKRLEALKALEAFAAAGLEKEVNSAIVDGVYSDSLATAQHTRKYLSTLNAADAAPVVRSLQSTIKTELSVRRRIDALRALAAIGSSAEPALDDLKTVLATKDPQVRIAAATAIKRIVGKDKYQKPVADVLGNELGIEVKETSSGVWGAVPRDANTKTDAFIKFTEDVIKEQELLFPPELPPAPRE